MNYRDKRMTWNGEKVVTQFVRNTIAEMNDISPSLLSDGDSCRVLEDLCNYVYKDGSWGADVSIPEGSVVSAYDIWLAKGNTGTEQDFLDSLKGGTGEAGTIKTITAATVGPSEPASVTNSGTPSAAVINLKIPRGQDGVMGPSGGVTLPVSGFFTVYVDEESNLWAVVPKGGMVPLHFDEETCNLYYIAKKAVQG